MELEVCKRCGRLFRRVQLPVCLACVTDEEKDYERIRATLGRKPGLTIEEVAGEAGVEVACVSRMLDAGQLENIAVRDFVPCGRCGAPAISASKRLCERCLTELDQKCAENIRELRTKLLSGGSSEMLNVHETVEVKRGKMESPPETRPGHRMVIQETRRKTRDGRKSK